MGYLRPLKRVVYVFSLLLSLLYAYLIVVFHCPRFFRDGQCYVYFPFLVLHGPKICLLYVALRCWDFLGIICLLVGINRPKRSFVVFAGINFGLSLGLEIFEGLIIWFKHKMFVFTSPTFFIYLALMSTMTALSMITFAKLNTTVSTDQQVTGGAVAPPCGYGYPMQQMVPQMANYPAQQMAPEMGTFGYPVHQMVPLPAQAPWYQYRQPGMAVYPSAPPGVQPQRYEEPPPAYENIRRF